jgi:hypothetical protein
LIPMCMKYRNWRLGMDNIKLGTQDIELRDGTHVDMPVEISPFFMQLVEVLAKDNPSWEFTPNYVSREYGEVLIEGRRYNQVSKLMATGLNVKQNKEELGKLSIEQYNGERYCVANSRIREQRSRGGETKTKDLKKALALVKKMFFPKTEEEIAKQCSDDIESSLDSFRRTHRYAFNEAWNRLGDDIQTYMENTLEVFLPYVKNPANRNVAEELGERIRKRNMSVAFSEAYMQHDASAIVIVGDTYYVWNKDQPRFKVSRDKVSDTVRAKVGMLKLLVKGDYREGIGLKSSDNVFIVSEYIQPNNVSVEEAK